jgi:hypothetical protein
MGRSEKAAGPQPSGGSGGRCLAAALLTVLLAACRLDVDFAASRYACDLTTSCPKGMACRQGFCSPEDAEDGSPGGGDDDRPDAAGGRRDAGPLDADAAPGSPDAAPDAAPPDVPECLLGRISDDFAAPDPASFWMPFVPQPPAVADQGSGRLVVTLAANAPGSHYAGYTYASNSDGRGQRVQVELLQVPNASSHANAFFKLQNGANFANQAGFLVQSNVLVMDTADAAGLLLAHKTLAYSAVAHRFLALAEADGEITFSTSPDGAVWTVRQQTPAPFPLENARVSLGAGTWQAEASPGVARFDNLNSGAATDCFGAAP